MGQHFPEGVSVEEVRRARHSGMLNHNVRVLEQLLSQYGLPSPMGDRLGVLPDDLIDVAVTCLQDQESELADLDDTIRKRVEIVSQGQMRTEVLRDQIVKVCNERDFLIRKYDAHHDLQKRDLQRACDEIQERKKRVLELQRKTQHLAHKNKVDTMDLERLQRAKPH